jgi:DNA-binding SARP family transcriptional activator
MATEFGLLGPLVVCCDGVVVAVQPGKQRAVLAALLLNAGRVVSVEELAEVLWGPAPPPSARVTVQNYVKRLRGVLGETGRARICTRPRGYLIEVAAGELDVTRFEALLGTARVAARAASWDTAAVRARAALELWRGEPLADVESELLAAREVPRLAELRLQAVEARIDADLHLGRQAEVIAELQRLTGVYPLREQLHGQLMLALYRCGRQAEALAAYQHARSVLVGELGSEPGAELRELHQQVLAADLVLTVPEPASPAGRSETVVPRELPAAVPHFAGRASELAVLTELLGQAGEQAAGTVVITAIGGTAGVGKTALAVQWAHRAASRFPDGQLYVNLRGYDPGRPVTAADALAGFLRALGLAGQDIPAQPEERAGRYRSLLAGKRVLVVLDNAGEVEQVRPLLPGTPTCAALVTSRDSLAGLVARDGARRLDLDLLPLGDAVGLLRALIGERAAADPGAAAALAVQCSRLPLALRVAAELAAARPAVPLAGLVRELDDQHRRLDLLDADQDPRTAVRAVFSWSYRHLDAGAARAFRLAGLHPGPDLDPYAAAALTGTTLHQAGRLLDQLARAHLIQPAGPGRHGLHDLLRAYARELAADQDTAAERQAALTRLFDHYLYSAATAADTLYPSESGRWRGVAPPDTPAPPLVGPAAARAWLDAGRPSLVAVATYAADHGWPDHAIRLATTLFRYLDVGGHYPERVAIHTCARRAARRTGDRAAEARALTQLGIVDSLQGRCEQATGQFQQALALYRDSGDEFGEARVLSNLGVVCRRQGRYQEATDYYRQARALFCETGHRQSEARALGNLGIVDERLGRYPQAIGHHQHSLALCREIGDRTAEAFALTNLGCVYRRQGHDQQAADHHWQAQRLFHEAGNRYGEACALGNLGDVELQQRHYQQAAGHHQQALALFRESGDRGGEAEALNGLGEVLLATSQPARARAQYAAALGLASQIGDQYEQARAHNGLARSYHATGDQSQARRHWQEALSRYTDLGAPEAGQIRAQLTAADDRGRLAPGEPAHDDTQ